MHPNSWIRWPGGSTLSTMPLPNMSCHNLGRFEKYASADTKGSRGSSLKWYKSHSGSGPVPRM
eukprot:9862562-Alexandrium_andersonii.AAC.1